MDENDARKLAHIFKGSAFHSGGNVWLVGIDTFEKTYTIISGDCVCEYTSQAAFENGEEAVCCVNL